MAGKGGARPGAGAPRGPRKTTIERALIAERDVLASKAAGKKLAKEVLEEFMLVFAGMAATYQPVETNPNKNPGEFVKYAELAIDCANKLAPYQSPTFRAIAVSAMPPIPVGPGNQGITGLEIELTDQNAVARIYRTFMTGSTPKALRAK